MTDGDGDAQHREDVSELVLDPLKCFLLDKKIGELVDTASASMANIGSSLGAPVSADELEKRLAEYDQAIDPLVLAMEVMIRWGTTEHHKRTVFEAIEAICTFDQPKQGLNLWISLHWYPVLKFIYACGITATWCGSDDVLQRMLTMAVREPIEENSGNDIPLVLKAVAASQPLNDGFKILEKYNRRRTPLSDLLYDRLISNGILSVRPAWKRDRVFDEFEIVMSLVHADLYQVDGGRFWCRPGRYAWKGFGGSDPYTRYIESAQRRGSEFSLLKVGLFSGEAGRFKEVAVGFSALLRGLNWY